MFQRFNALALQRLGLLFLVLAAGCENGNRRAATEQWKPTPVDLNVRSETVRPDERILFSSVTPTNQVRPEWLSLPTNFFRLGPGDAFDIELLGETSPPANVLVGPDGRIYYSLLGGAFVWGLTLTEARSLLETNLARYLRTKPEVALTLRTSGSRKVWILGSVQKPGIYPLSAPATLLEAISAAGGVGALPAAVGTLVAGPGAPRESSAGAAILINPVSSDDTADLEDSFLLREGQLMPIDFARLIRQGDLSQNVYLQADDFVYVRSARSKGDIYVLGAVAQPNIVDYKSHSTVLSAISSVGGPAQYAYLSHVAVVRGSLVHPTIATFDYGKIATGKALDVKLEPGDIVYIPFSPFRKIEQLADEILQEFVRTTAINAGQRVVNPNATPVSVAVPSGAK